MGIVSSRDPYTSFRWSGGTEEGWRESTGKGFKWEGGTWVKDMNNPMNQPTQPGLYPPPGGAQPSGPSGPYVPAGRGVGGSSASRLSGGGGRTGWETTFGDPFDYADKATNVLNMEFDRAMQRSQGMLNEDLYGRGIGNSPAAAKLAQWDRQDIEGRRLAAIAGLYKDPYSKIKNEPAQQSGEFSGRSYQPGPGPAYEGAYDPNMGFSGDRTAGKTFYGGRTPQEEKDYQYNKQVQGFAPKGGGAPAGGGGGGTNPSTGEPIRGKGESYDQFMARWNAWFNYNKGSAKKAPVPSGQVDISGASFLY